MYSKKYVKYLTMFTYSSHSLAIETGRYQGVLNVNIEYVNFVKMMLKMNFILFLNVRLTRISDLNISNRTLELDHLFLNLYSC